MKHTEQFKRFVVQRYLDGPAGYTLLARELGLSTTTLRNWVARFERHGDAGLSARVWSKYSDKFKLSVLKHMRDNGLSYREAAVEFNLSNSKMVVEWARRHESGVLGQAQRQKKLSMMKPRPVKNTTPLDDEKRSQKELIRELEYLRAENAVLKKVKALVESKKSALEKKQK